MKVQPIKNLLQSSKITFTKEPVVVIKIKKPEKDSFERENMIKPITVRIKENEVTIQSDK